MGLADGSRETGIARNRKNVLGGELEMLLPKPLILPRQFLSHELAKRSHGLHSRHRPFLAFPKSRAATICHAASRISIPGLVEAINGVWSLCANEEALEASAARRFFRRRARSRAAMFRRRFAIIGLKIKWKPSNICAKLYAYNDWANRRIVYALESSQAKRRGVQRIC